MAASVLCPADVLLPAGGGSHSQPAVLAVLQGVSQGLQQEVHVVLGRVVAHEADPQHLEEKGGFPLQHPPLGHVWGIQRAVRAHVCAPQSVPI